MTRSRQYLPFQTSDVIRIEEFVYPSASVIERLRFLVRRPDVGFTHRAEVVVVRQTHRFDREGRCNVLVSYADQVIAVVLFAAEREI